MLKKLLFICLAISFFACDDESSNVKEADAETQDAVLEAEADAGTLDAALPIQHYDFNAMEIEPNLDGDD